MSQVMERRAAAFARGASLAVDVQELEILEVEEEQYGSSGSEGEGDGERGVGRAHGQPSLASGAASGSSSSAAAGTSGQPTGEPAGPPGTLPKASMGAASLGTMFRSDAERREWVMLKLRALIDSMCELEGAAYQERQQNAHAGGCGRRLLEWACLPRSVICALLTAQLSCTVNTRYSPLSAPCPPPLLLPLQTAWRRSCWWCTPAST